MPERAAWCTLARRGGRLRARRRSVREAGPGLDECTGALRSTRGVESTARAKRYRILARISRHHSRQGVKIPKRRRRVWVWETHTSARGRRGRVAPTRCHPLCLVAGWRPS